MAKTKHYLQKFLVSSYSATSHKVELSIYKSKKTYKN